MGVNKRDNRVELECQGLWEGEDAGQHVLDRPAVGLGPRKNFTNTPPVTMSYVQSFGQYFGLFGGDLEEVNKGKRRTVLWLTFVTWCILIGSTAGPDWILGGLEFGGDTQATANQAHFHVNLNTVLIEVCVMLHLL